MAMNLFGKSGVGLSAIAFEKEAKPATSAQLEILKRAAGLVAADTRDQNIIEAYQKPDVALLKWQTARKAVDQRAADEYLRVGSVVEEAGYSKDAAMAYALDRFKDYHKKESELIALSHPYANDVEQLMALSSTRGKSVKTE